jgi:hypothetical protein
MTGGSQGLWSFPGRRRWRAIASGLFACALGATACGGGQPAVRGFGSTELEPIRDSTLVLEGESAPGVLIYGTGGPGGGVPASANYWTLNLSTGAVQDYGAEFPPFPSSTPSPPSPYTCMVVSTGVGSTFTLQIVENSTGAETDVEVIGYAQCPGADGNLVAIVAGPSGFQLSMGPFTQLVPVPLALQIDAVDWWSVDAVTSAPATVTVQAALPSAPDEVGVYTVDLSSHAITENIPAVPASVAWASGATAAGSLQSTAVSLARPARIGDHYLYSRAMSDGGFTTFAGPFSSGAPTDLALFQLPPEGTLDGPDGVTHTPSADGSYQHFAPLAIWQLTNGAGADSELLVWDDAARQVIDCPSSPTARLGGVRSSDGSKVLFVTPQSCCQYQGSGPLSLLALGDGQGNASACTLLAASNVVTAAFAPDGSAMFWLVQPAPGDTQLWAAAGDGSGAHMIGAGLLQNVHFVVPGEAQLELIRNGDLLWLDLHDSAVQLHYIAEQVFQEIYDIGVGGWLITAYNYSTQAGTATLGLVNRNTGEKRPISPDVAEFMVLVDTPGADGDLFPDSSTVSMLTVVYVVRGRNPSPQDGIWSATVTTADLQ